MAKGRPRKWWPRRVDAARLTIGRSVFEQLENKYRNMATKKLYLRLEQDWNNFLSCNSLPADAESVRKLVYDILAGPIVVARGQLRLTSMSEYLTKLANTKPFKADFIIRNTLKGLQRTIAIAAADEEIKHAVDITPRDALEIISAVDDSWGRVLLSIMVITRIRSKDASFLAKQQVNFFRSTRTDDLGQGRKKPQACG